MDREIVGSEEEMFDGEVKQLLNEMTGQSVCRQRVGASRSLSIGFGERIAAVKVTSSEPYYGQWEIGSYNSSWRIISGNRILIGSQDTFDSIKQFDDALQKITLPSFERLEQRSNFEIAVVLADGVVVQFWCASNCDDEMFHIFAPNDVYAEYKPHAGWRVGKSNVPWI